MLKRLVMGVGLIFLVACPQPKKDPDNKPVTSQSTSVATGEGVTYLDPQICRQLLWTWDSPSSRCIPPGPDQASASLVRMLDALEGADPSRKLALFAAGWSEVRDCQLCSAFANAESKELGALVLSDPGFSCGKGLGGASEGESPWSVAVKSCGREHYKLPEGAESLLSPEWYLLQKISSGIQAIRAKASKENVAALDKALERASLSVVLPLPRAVEGLYALPLTTNTTTPDGLTSVLIVTPTELRLSGWPTLRLTPQGVELSASWPGRKIETGALVAELGALLPKREAAATAPTMEVPAPGNATSAPTSNKMSRSLTAMDVNTLLSSRGISLELAPLALFFDKALPSMRLVEVLRAFPERLFSLAVENGAQDQMAHVQGLRFYTVRPSEVERFVSPDVSWWALRLTKEGCRLFVESGESALFTSPEGGCSAEKLAAATTLGDGAILLVQEGQTIQELLSLALLVGMLAPSEVQILLLANEDLPAGSPLRYKEN